MSKENPQKTKSTTTLLKKKKKKKRRRSERAAEEEMEEASAAAVEAEEEVARRLEEAVEEIAAISDYRNAYKKQFCSLARRIKMLSPMLDELRDTKGPLSPPAARSLLPLTTAVDSARELLRSAADSSKICMVLDRDVTMKRFQEVTAQLEQALTEISFDNLNISDEVREQVELVHSQFKRAKYRVDTLDDELYSDLSTVYNKSAEASVDASMLQRLAEKLQLTTILDLKQESLALHELVVSNGGGDPGENIEKMSMLLKKIKDFVQTQNPQMDTPANLKPLPSVVKLLVPVIPEDFRCPISLELMKDPVIVATGQTYERGFIEKWLQAGHETCPKTQQKLPHTSLTTNYVLRSLIGQWCEANGVDPPKRPSQPINPPSSCSSSEHSRVEDLIRKLSSTNIEDQGSAAGELRLLSKRNAANRVCIAKAGAIPVLACLLSTPDSRTQEHAVTALLNLSICEENKGSIVSSGVLCGIIHVLKNGSMEARENAAATLFSLSVVDENKVTIGASGAIPALVKLLNEGSRRGKKDAATALFNLCIYQGNKGKAVRASVVPALMVLLKERGGRMMDEALAILSVLVSHPEGKAAIGAAEAVPLLVETIRSGSPRGKENAAAVLVHLCGGEQHQLHLTEAQECGLMLPLQELAQNGTDRGKRKAVHLLERINRFLEQQKQAETHAEALAQALVQQSSVPADIGFHS